MSRQGDIEQRPKENEGQERAGHDPGLSGPVLLLPQRFNVKNEVMLKSKVISLQIAKF